jgi:hypothetical protein
VPSGIDVREYAKIHSLDQVRCGRSAFRFAYEVRADEILLHVPGTENFVDSSQVLAGEGGVSDEPEAMGRLGKRTRDCTLQRLNTWEGDARSQTPVSSG